MVVRPSLRPWLLLFLPALLLRYANVALLGDDPIVRWPVEDGLSYAKWAHEIAAGDWFGRGRPVFYQAPLYPYVLAVLQKLGLGFYPWPQLLHASAGALTAMLAFATTRRLFDERAAWIAGGIFALWGPALMYEATTDKVALGLFAASLILFLLVDLRSRLVADGDGDGDGEAQPMRAASSWPGARASESPDSVGPGASSASTATLCSTRRILGVGVALGIGTLLRENLLLFAPVAALALFVATRRAKVAGLLLAGCAIGMLPSFVHNLAIGGEALPTSYQGGTNLWIGNHEGAEGTYEALRAGRGDPIFEEQDARAIAAAARGVRPEEIASGDVQRFWIGRVLDFVRDDPGAWLGLQLRKLQWFAYHAEAPDTVAYAAFREGHLWLLPSRVLFGLLLPLALLGMGLAFGRAEARFAIWLALAAAASVVAFYVVSRYRLSCLPFLLPFAGFAASELISKPRPIPIVACCLLLLPTQRWWLERAPSGLGVDDQRLVLAINRGTALGTWRSEEPQLAIAELDRALEIAPELPQVHRSLVRLHLRAKAYGRAAMHAELVLEREPGDLETRHNLGFARLQLGELREAESAFRMVLAAAGADAPKVTREQLAICLERQGRRKDAAEIRANTRSQPGR